MNFPISWYSSPYHYFLASLLDTGYAKILRGLSWKDFNSEFLPLRMELKHLLVSPNHYFPLPISPFFMVFGPFNAILAMFVSQMYSVGGICGFGGVIDDTPCLVIWNIMAFIDHFAINRSYTSGSIFFLLVNDSLFLFLRGWLLPTPTLFIIYISTFFPAVDGSAYCRLRGSCELWYLLLSLSLKVV